jgi:hypothetical protein
MISLLLSTSEWAFVKQLETLWSVIADIAGDIDAE